MSDLTFRKVKEPNPDVLCLSEYDVLRDGEVIGRVQRRDVTKWSSRAGRVSTKRWFANKPGSRYPDRSCFLGGGYSSRHNAARYLLRRVDGETA